MIWREGERVFRLPKPLDPEVAAAYEKPFANGWPRGLREVATERSLLNAAGTFYVLPRTTSGGAAKIQPVASHGKRITDFCSWRGLLVLAGVREAARNDPRVIGDGAGSIAGSPVAVTVEIDPAGDGQWLLYATLAVPPGDSLNHEFPAGFSAHWIRFTAEAACRATATLIYE